MFFSKNESTIKRNFCLFQPVGFVTFSTRAGAESAKQDLQVRNIKKSKVALITATSYKLSNQQSTLTKLLTKAFGRKLRG